MLKRRGRAAATLVNEAHQGVGTGTSRMRHFFLQNIFCICWMTICLCYKHWVGLYLMAWGRLMVNHRLSGNNPNQNSNYEKNYRFLPRRRCPDVDIRLCL
jgi:hypothetical protein